MELKAINLVTVLGLWLSPQVLWADGTDSIVCQSFEDGIAHYGSHVGNTSGVKLPSDFAMHDVKMAKGVKFTIPRGKSISENRFEKWVSVDNGFRDRVANQSINRKYEYVSTVQLACMVKKPNNYKMPEIGHNRSVSVKEKALGIPTVKSRKMEFPFRDDGNGNYLKLICGITAITIAEQGRRDYVLAGARINQMVVPMNDLVKIINDAGIIEGTMCPAADVFIENQHDDSQLSVL